MTDRATDLLTEDGRRLGLGKRTGAVMMEIYALRERIDAGRQGQLEIAINFSNSSLSVSVKEKRDLRKIE